MKKKLQRFGGKDIVYILVCVFWGGGSEEGVLTTKHLLHAHGTREAIHPSGPEDRLQLPQIPPAAALTQTFAVSLTVH